MKIEIESVTTWVVTFTNDDSLRSTSVVRTFDTLTQLIEYLTRLDEERATYIGEAR